MFIHIYTFIIIALCGYYSINAETAKKATNYTARHNAKYFKKLPFQNRQDFKDAQSGLISELPNNGIIKNSEGEIIWDISKYDFLKKNWKVTANPSLWRQAELLRYNGLFKIHENIYQIRSADLSNMTIIESKNGIIIIDPLISEETAKAGLELYYNKIGYKPIKAIIYTHSHVDHFGGVKGIISENDIQKNNIDIIAPEGFIKAALEENIFAGNVMARRASYMYGNLLNKNPRGQISCGLGLTTSTGKTSLILPNKTIYKSGEKITIDGIKLEFLMANNSEAPSEFIIFIPQFKALCLAEDAVHSMHNLYTLRGAKVRDARLWVSYLQEVLDTFVMNTNICFAQHMWPVWGNKRVTDFIEKQRDMYKYIHDQTLRLANKGFTMTEIAETIKLPKSLSSEWYNRGYYGSLNHNIKAVYNFYLGWFDGNPSTLHQLPPVESSKKYIEYMGGADSVLKKAEKDFEKGEYRWVAQVLNHLVFADPKNTKCRKLLANTLEQLGYQSENGVWRNFYLSGCKELRYGIDPNLKAPVTASIDILKATPFNLLLDYLSICLDGPKAADKKIEFDILLPESKEQWRLMVSNGVLNYTQKHKDKTKNLVTIKKIDLIEIILGIKSIDTLKSEGKLSMTGDDKILNKFISLLDKFNFWFNIIEPNKH